MKKIFILLIIFSMLITGCDYIKNYTKNKKYHGKIFKVEIWKGEGNLEIWENANELSYDSEENIYTFYVNGKLIEVNGFAVILTEVGAPKPTMKKVESK